MAAWVQQRDGVMPATVAVLLRMEVGDEVGTMGRVTEPPQR
jgi:hypothetical protein